MKTMIKNRLNGLYVADRTKVAAKAGEVPWTADLKKALNFKSIDDTETFVMTWNLKNVDFAFSVSPSYENIVCPIARAAIPCSFS